MNPISLILFISFLKLASTDSSVWPKSLSLLYSNLDRYDLQNGINQNIGRICMEDMVYVDYSRRFNSYAVVCSKGNHAYIQSIKMNHSLKEAFSANTTLIKIDNVHQSYFALDWNQGLFYFSTESIIYVVNMKTTVVEEHIIYSTETTIITGLAVKPDEAKLVWLEYSKINFSTWIMEGTQDGKNVKTLMRIKHANIEQLIYDYKSQNYMSLVMRTTEERECWIINVQTKKIDKIKVNPIGRTVNTATFYDHYIFYDSSIIDMQTGMSLDKEIDYFDVNLKLETNGTGSRSILLEMNPRYNRTRFIAPMDWKSRPNVEDRCVNHLCKHDLDFCIPNTPETYTCMLNLHQIYETYLTIGQLYRNKLFLIAIWTVSLLLLIIVIALLFVFLNKKKVRFYQIRLKKINRVNSSKLGPKPEATDEIAD